MTDYCAVYSSGLTAIRTCKKWLLSPVFHGLNYGWVFLSYGVAGIFGPQIAGHFVDAAKAAGATGAAVDAWKMPFIIAGVACLAGAVISAAVRPPRPKAKA